MTEPVRLWKYVTVNDTVGELITECRKFAWMCAEASMEFQEFADLAMESEDSNTSLAAKSELDLANTFRDAAYWLEELFHD